LNALLSEPEYSDVEQAQGLNKQLSVLSRSLKSYHQFPELRSELTASMEDLLQDNTKYKDQIAKATRYLELADDAYQNGNPIGVHTALQEAYSNSPDPNFWWKVAAAGAGVAATGVGLWWLNSGGGGRGPYGSEPGDALYSNPFI
jgi:hypothetical protein